MHRGVTCDRVPKTRERRSRPRCRRARRGAGSARFAGSSRCTAAWSRSSPRSPSAGRAGRGLAPRAAPTHWSPRPRRSGWRCSSPTARRSLSPAPKGCSPRCTPGGRGCARASSSTRWGRCASSARARSPECAARASACCYEFSETDLDGVVALYGPLVRGRTGDGAPALDLPAAVSAALAAAGATERHGVDECTGCGSGYFSHRARRDTGRQVLLVWRTNRSSPG